jgi:hypothetical protein
VVREHFVDLIEEMLDFRALLALDGFAHERRRSHRDRTPLAVEAQIGNPVAFETHGDVQAIAT